MIAPTVGRVVWYSHNHEASPYPRLGDQPFAAHVAFVHTERLVNLLVISHTGHTFARENVILLQEDDTAPIDAPYAEWMPYQKGQAAKTEAAEKATASVEQKPAAPPPPQAEPQAQQAEPVAQPQPDPASQPTPVPEGQQ